MSDIKAQQDVSADLKDAAPTVQERFSELRDGLASAAGNAMEAGKAAVESTTSGIKDAVNCAKDSAAGLLEGTTQRIAQRPLTSVLVAAGIGFLAGIFICRK